VVADAAAFLAGPCSCQVKAQNPGMDLPLAAAWDSVFAEVVYQEVELPPLAAISLAPAGEDSAAPDESAGTAAKEPPPPAAEARMDVRQALPFAVFGLLVLAGSLGLLLRRRRQS
jgi:LPXTG-motif cell wall-anchored protein